MHNSYSPRRGVYLIHFDAPYKHARHYIGCTPDLLRRTRAHLTGKANCKLTQAAYNAGINMRVARTWPGASWSFERTLHRRKNSRHLCPICNPNAERYPKPRIYNMPKGYTDPF